uniref:Uncharacterized protein n=1 Tax=Heterorhabditis bacteriophora TaxID=37862 RepID=A0A1I7WY86_HETBA
MNSFNQQKVIESEGKYFDD